MKPRTLSLNPAQQQSVKLWWQALQPQSADQPLPPDLWGLGRGARARLRRCTSVDELLLEPAVHLLAHRLIRDRAENMGWLLPDGPDTFEQIALVAGVLALVSSEPAERRTLAQDLGEHIGPDRRRMSTLRFTRLQRSQGADELLTQWRRAVKLLNGQADVVQLADDLLAWQREAAESSQRVAHGVRFHWAHDYFLPARDRAVVADGQADEDAEEQADPPVHAPAAHLPNIAG